MTNPTLTANVEAFGAAWVSGANAARAMLGAGKPFIGAFGVADQLGFARDSLEWDAAMHGAHTEIKKVEVYIDRNGVQV